MFFKSPFLSIAVLLLGLSALASSATVQHQKRRTFTHPGIFHSSADLLRIRTKVNAKEEPWYTAYTEFAANSRSQSTYTINGPKSFVTRDNTIGFVGLYELIQDCRAAYDLALRYSITRDAAYATKSRDILNAYDIQLGASITGVHLVNAAEILRYDWTGWAAADITKFSNMIQNIFAPAVHAKSTSAYPYSGGWGTLSMKAFMAFGVFLNSDSLYNEALTLYDSDACGKLSFMIASTALAREYGGDVADLGKPGRGPLGKLSNRLLLGYEYTAKYNFGNDGMPYDAAVSACGASWSAISTILYAHFAVDKGLAAPYTKQVIQKVVREKLNPVNADADSFLGIDF
ncbi:putative secreted protein [Morchella snyderi]|nr:putative secreted protein [Morchella snyderi]